MKSMRMSWVEHVAHIGEINAYNFLVRISEEEETTWKT
jgi:hypothetical protein